MARLIAILISTILLYPSSKPFPPAQAIRSSLLLQFHYKKSQNFHNAETCPSITSSETTVCDPSIIHVATTLDSNFLRGSVAAVNSILQHSHCPDNVFLHFISSDDVNHKHLIKFIFPSLKSRTYYFDPETVKRKISPSLRQGLEQPLNYARNYLAHLLEPCVERVIYLDSDVLVVDDILKLWTTDLKSKAVGSPEYCHANFTKYFTPEFWSRKQFSGVFANRTPCYFNTGVMVMDLRKWRMFGYTEKIEEWMEMQRNERIYELGSLPPFLLVFAGNVEPIDHRWNQHGLGGDNVKGSCRELHPGPASLLHWSGGGKPWLRLDSGHPCPLDILWSHYDLYGPS